MEGAGSVRFHRTTYDRSAVKPGIVHLGYGAFHRAHQAVFLDDYMENSGDLNWGIVAVNLRAPDAAGFAKAQSARDGYMLKSIDTAGRCCWQLVRSHVGFVDWSRSPGEAEGLLSTGSIHGVTLTVTESGYYLGDNGSVNLDDPVLRDEVSNGSSCTVYGFLARALERRAKTVDAPVSILCCDNIRGNGRMLRSNFLAYLDHTDREWLRDWVEGNVAFPCSMVDRITPRATDELRLETQALFPGTTLNPIHSEAFIQWVLEDRFAGPMPDLERAGVQVVADVDAYEEAKIRILNGGHAGLAYLGALAGFTTFDEAINDSVLRAHFDGWERKEVLPGLTIDLPFDKHAYLDEVTDRFRNTAIADQLERICMDGWSKMPIYIRPTLASCLKQGILPIHGFDCVAGWYVYARRHSAGKMPVHYIEPYWNLLEPYLAHGEEANFARAPELWGDLPRTYTEFTPGDRLGHQSDGKEMAGVTIENVSKSYGQIRVIHGVDLEVQEGEFVVFVGPSGCGKSTLLRMIAGLEEISDGTIHIGEVVVNDVAPAKRGVAMVFQTYALYPHMTVYKNMAFGLKQARTPKDEIDRRVRAAAEVLHITEFLDRSPRALSGGQRQRVAIGRAIVREPKVFLFDEPLSNLDAALRVQTRLEIARLHERLDATMIYVTHDQVEAMTLADRIVVLKDGRIEQVGTPVELYEQPANTFVAGFIGSPKMNFFSVSDLADSAPSFLKDLDSADCVIGIRPEHLRLCAAGEGMLSAKLELVENLGEYVLVHMVSAEGTEFVTKMEIAPDVASGAELSFSAPFDRIHYFDGTTGMRTRSVES